MLLAYAIQQEIGDIEKYTLSLELHNFYYLRELLLTDTYSSEELAILAFLFDINVIQLEKLHRYYEFYIVKVHEVCPLLNTKLCGQMYTNVVRQLYRQCKCETLTEYFQNFFVSTCMKYFQCHVVTYLQDLYIDGVLHLSQEESSYINLVVGSHCNGRYTRHTNSLLCIFSFLYLCLYIIIWSNFYFKFNNFPYAFQTLSLYIVSKMDKHGSYS